MPSWFSGPKFDQHKLKASLGMSRQRIRIHLQKKNNAIANGEREVRDLLTGMGDTKDSNKVERAFIMVEGVIRDENTKAALETLALHAALLEERIRLVAIDRDPKPAPELRSAMSTIIWASQRCEVKEFTEVAKQLALKYDRDFIDTSLDGSNASIQDKVQALMTVDAPPTDIKVRKIQESTWSAAARSARHGPAVALTPPPRDSPGEVGRGVGRGQVPARARNRRRAHRLRRGRRLGRLGRAGGRLAVVGT